MLMKGKILPVSRATWFLSLGVGAWVAGCPAPPLPSCGSQLPRIEGQCWWGLDPVGCFLGGVVEGGEWEFVPQQGKSQAGMNTGGCPNVSWDCRVLRVSEHAATTAG